MKALNANTTGQGNSLEVQHVPQPYGFIVRHVATCNSDYFSGHHLSTFSIMVDGTSTYQQIKDEMLDYQTTEHLEYPVFYYEYGVYAYFTVEVRFDGDE